MKEPLREHPKIIAAAERQMRAWELIQRAAEESARPRLEERLPAKFGSFVAISGEAGAGGSELALDVGQRLGWEVLDKNLLDCIAQRYHLSRPMLELVDETICNWAYDILGAFLDPKIVPHEKYVAHLCRIVTAAARRGNIVLVGRGAAFMLPRGHGIAVQVVAPEHYRIEHLMKLRGISEAQARRFMTEVDRGRREFVRRFFHHDITDPHQFDLVINRAHMDRPTAVDLIVAASHARSEGMRTALEVAPESLPIKAASDS